MNVRGGACAVLRFLLSLPVAYVLNSPACSSTGGNQNSDNMLLNVSNLCIGIVLHCPDSKLRGTPPLLRNGPISVRGHFLSRHDMPRSRCALTGGRISRFLLNRLWLGTWLSEGIVAC